MKITKSHIILIILLISPFVYRSDWFKREFFPKEYWSKQVSSFEGNLSLDESMLRDTAIEIKKLQITRDLRIYQEVNFAKSVGISVAETRKETIDSIKMEMEVLRSEMKMWRDNIDKDKKNLDHAKTMLSHYK